MSDRDETYVDVSFAKDLRYLKEVIVPAGRLTPDLLNEYYLQPGKVIRIPNPQPLRDTYGYWAMFALGYGAGAITILCALGR